MPAITSILSTAAAFVGLGLAVPHASIAARQLATRSNASPSVTVKNGTIAGIHQPIYNQDFFLGRSSSSSRVTTIRYAVTKCPLCAKGFHSHNRRLNSFAFAILKASMPPTAVSFRRLNMRPCATDMGYALFSFFCFFPLCFILLIIHRWRLT